MRRAGRVGGGMEESRGRFEGDGGRLRAGCAVAVNEVLSEGE